ncbi:MAG: WD40/YVTN/BNR-like repeat-containing protein, partial [Vicinamibacterales bacterium]
FKTSDYGKSWTKITNGIPGDDFTRVIREDTKRKGLLYAGTETGIYVTFDDGGNWHKLGGNFPVVPIHDLIVHNDDLVIGTHGRSFWIFDDLTTIRQMADEVASKAAHLFKPRDTIRYGKLRGFGHRPVAGRNYHFAAGFIPAFKYEEDEAGNPKWTYIDAGNNPPEGVLVRYYLADKPSGGSTPDEISLTVLDSKGNTLREFIPKKEKAGTSSAEQQAESPDFPASLTGASPDEEEQPGPYLPVKAGMNFFNWTLRSADSVKIKTKGGDQPPVTGPVVPPGNYQLRLTVDGESQTQEVQVLPDPRVESGQADYQAQ